MEYPYTAGRMHISIVCRFRIFFQDFIVSFIIIDYKVYLSILQSLQWWWTCIEWQGEYVFICPSPYTLRDFINELVNKNTWIELEMTSSLQLL